MLAIKISEVKPIGEAEKGRYWKIPGNLFLKGFHWCGCCSLGGDREGGSAKK